MIGLGSAALDWLDRLPAWAQLALGIWAGSVVAVARIFHQLAREDRPPAPRGLVAPSNVVPFRQEVS